ncbi:protein IQ-DOMAIN 32-like [Cucurbita moschata]|uniref:Protein IQ-DOMAIN 32-like n=1 Tax=Cucurbita moschata TaxID=3662 RepID=A0A6J1GIX0_CUCMO|nr:protein IQ-DOMAIN 32-like [Cucurbita moschata]
MGRPCSCFQLVTCGSDSKDGDEIDVHQNKDSKVKRGWSFRKRSSQHRVLNNTVIAETPVEKENLETATIDFQSSANSTVPEKPAIVHFTNEEACVPNIETPKGSDKVDVASENESKVDSKVENPKGSDKVDVGSEYESKVDSEVKESIVIVIQAGIRGILARRELIKLKNVVKVQAAVRGFLVRRHAVGTLRCAQAIIKMQTIVRARRAHLSRVRSAQDELYKEIEKENPDSKIAVKGEMTKSNSRYISIGKLLTNSFARQLLESTPRNKPITIKCVPSKNDSAWRWLERWLAVSSLEVLESAKEVSATEEPKKEESDTGQMERETEEPKKEESDTEQMQREIDESHVEDGIESKVLNETEDLNSNSIKSVSKETSLSVRENLEQPQPENARTSESKETSAKVNAVQDQKTQLGDASLRTESSSSSDKLLMNMEQVNPLKRLAPQKLENESKKFMLGSRKVSNPSFINAQAKFERLSSAPVSVGTISSMHQNDGIKPHSEAVSSRTDTVQRTKKPSADENSVLPGSRIIQVGGSECSTELSISSTLDSPDRSEAGLADPRANVVSKKGVQDPSNDLIPEVVVKGSTALVDQPKEANESNGPFVASVAVVDSVLSESKPERSSDEQREQEADTGHHQQTYIASPVASPRSHLTVPDSQGTPSSQVSIKSKRGKTDKTVSFQKQKSSAAGKQSPSSLNRNSATSSTENSCKDQKTWKRRNSFDSARHENVEKELKASSSSNSLPHFMQATESARAKLHSVNSPRSSPDVQDREIKKRHSLPAEGRQGSPRVQQPTSRTPQGAKGNEKMWRR